MDSRNDALLVAGIGLVALVVSAAIFWFAVPRGFGLTDEALTVYLLLHPNAPMASMDHFVVGHLLDLMPWNVIGLRWLTILVSLAVPMLLALSVSLWGRRFFRLEPSSFVLLSVFAILGGLLCFTAIRPLPNYTFNLVIACDLFAAVYFVTGARTFAGAVPMGLLAGIIFLARIPVFPFVLLFLFAGAWAEGRSPLGKENLWRVARVAVVALIFIGVLVLAGLDLPTQFGLMRVLVTTSHQPGGVILRDMGYGALLLAIAAALAGIEMLFLRTAQVARRNSVVLVALLVLGAAAAVAYMLWLGFATPSAAPDALPGGNDALRSLGPALHVGVMSLFPLYGLRGPKDRGILKPCLLLYLLCLLPQIGTNTGLWHRSTANMAPLFLVVALILVDGVRQGRILRGVPAPITAAVSLPVMLALLGSLVMHPMSIFGSAVAQTIRLDHPMVLAGVRVAPSVAALQVRLERQLAAVHFDRSREALLPGPSRLGLVVLAGADALGNGWYFSGYPESENWNCAVTNLWMPLAPSRVVAIDAGTLQAASGDCLARYDVPLQRQGFGRVSILTRRW